MARPKKKTGVGRGGEECWLLSIPFLSAFGSRPWPGPSALFQGPSMVLWVWVSSELPSLPSPVQASQLHSPVLCWMGELFRCSQANASSPFFLAYCGAVGPLVYIKQLSVLFWSRSERETSPWPGLSHFVYSSWLPFPFWTWSPPFFQCLRPEKHLLRLTHRVLWVFCRVFWL